MSKQRKNFIMIGLDGAIPEFIERYVNEGILPNIAKVMKRGAYARAFPAFPCDTPTNWTTIATGAWPGTHGINGFNVHLPGETLTTVHKTLNTSLCQAEYIWDKAEEAGWKCVLLCYPGTFPPTLKRGITIQGMHEESILSPNNPVPFPSKMQTIDSMTIFQYGLEKGDKCHIARPVEFSFLKEKDWKNLPFSNLPIKTAKVPLSGSSSLEWTATGWEKSTKMKSGKSKVLYFLMIASGSGGYDKLIICRDKDASKPLSILKPGQWSEWHKDLFFMEDGTKVEGIFIFKLLSLSPDGSQLKLYRSKIYKTKGWIVPEEWAVEIEKNVGPYIYGFEQGAGSIDMKLLFEHIEKQVDYYVELVAFLKKKYDWNFLMLKMHVQDAFNHWFLTKCEKSWIGYKEEEDKKCRDYFRKSYQHMDRLVGRIINELSDDNTIICIISDHGAIAAPKKIDYRPAFIKEGLLAYQKIGDEFILDISRTQAVFVDDKVFVNLEGREQGGIVKKDEYEKVRNKVIQVLLSIRDPETGECPLEIVCRKEALETLGIWGERYGDICVMAKPGYWLIGGDINHYQRFKEIPRAEDPVVSANFQEGEGPAVHFGILPNAKLGWASNQAFVIFSGPGIKENYRKHKSVWLIDIAPTIAYLLGIKKPSQSEGNIISDFINDYV